MRHADPLLHACIMQMLRVAVRDDLELIPKPPPSLPDAAMIYAEVSNFTDKPRPAELNADDLIARLIRVCKGQVRGRGRREISPSSHTKQEWWRLSVHAKLIPGDPPMMPKMCAFLRRFWGCSSRPPLSMRAATTA